MFPDSSSKISPIFKKIQSGYRNAAVLNAKQFDLDLSNKHEFLKTLSNSDKVSPEVKKEFESFFLKKAVIADDSYPVLKVEDGMLVLDEVAQEWLKKLKPKEGLINKIIPSVGRIEWENHPDFPSPNHYLGTGFLIKNGNFIITNRHVAKYFVDLDRLTFKVVRKRRLKPRIDFLEEMNDYEIQELETPLTKIVYISKDPEIDLAIFKIDKASLNHVLKPLQLSRGEIKNEKLVIAVGYPNNVKNYQHDFYERDRVFKFYKYKRVSPGHIIKADIDSDILENEGININKTYFHSCSTIQGYSGAPLVNLENGEVVGLHSRGIYKKANMALKSSTILEVLDQINV